MGHENANSTPEGEETSKIPGSNIKEVPADDPIYQRGWMIGVPRGDLAAKLKKAQEMQAKAEMERKEDHRKGIRMLSMEAYEAMTGRPYREEEHGQEKPER